MELICDLGNAQHTYTQLEDILQSNFNQGIVYRHGPTGILVSSLTPLPPLSARNNWKVPFKLTNSGYFSSNLQSFAKDIGKIAQVMKKL